RIRETVFERTQVSVSIGGGTRRVIAKLATNFAKPAGVHIVPAGEEETEKVLLDGISKAEFSYFGIAENDETPSWRDEWQEQKTLPDLVRLSVTFADGEAWPETDPMTAGLVDANTVVVVNKIDLKAPDPPLEVNGQPALGISALRGDGIDGLLAALTDRVSGMVGGTAPSAPVLTRARHREALEESRAALKRFLAAAGDHKMPELAAEDLRLAARALGRITGRVDVDEVLDVIFRDFCIGK
ncbi:MAG: hypothetical protein IIC56_04460, partial [Proteobacteria bacterium]|nr:hypothetical protein [Pseudomonadota bacterium]